MDGRAEILSQVCKTSKPHLSVPKNTGEAGDLHFCFTFSQMATRVEMGFPAGKNGLDSNSSSMGSKTRAQEARPFI